MDIITQIHTTLGTDSIGFVFQVMALIASTAFLIYISKTAYRCREDRIEKEFEDRFHKEIESRVKNEIDPFTWDPESDDDSRVFIVTRKAKN